MKSFNKAIVIVCLLCPLLWYCEGLSRGFSSLDYGDMDARKFEKQFLNDQARTVIHHAVKRFMVIVPAIFFKLGVAFTLLIVVTLASVGNGIVGFLLLVVGLANVLARIQDFRRTTAPPSPSPISLAYGQTHQVPFWQRRDQQTLDRDNFMSDKQLRQFKQFAR